MPGINGDLAVGSVFLPLFCSFFGKNPVASYIFRIAAINSVANSSPEYNLMHPWLFPPMQQMITEFKSNVTPVGSWSSALQTSPSLGPAVPLPTSFVLTHSF